MYILFMLDNKNGFLPGNQDGRTGVLWTKLIVQKSKGSIFHYLQISDPFPSSRLFWYHLPGVNSLWFHLPRGQSTLQGIVKSSKDIDVEKEEMRVFEGRTSGDILVLYNLSKHYRRSFQKIIAVQDISLGIPKGEVMKLLFLIFFCCEPVQL